MEGQGKQQHTNNTHHDFFIPWVIVYPAPSRSQYLLLRPESLIANQVSVKVNRASISSVLLILEKLYSCKRGEEVVHS